MQPRQGRWWLAILPPLVLVVLVVHVAVVAGGRTWADRARITEQLPARLAVVDAISEGHAPEWWDGAGLGAPLWAEPSHGAAYPGWWAAAAAPRDRAPWAIDLIAVLHALWAALGAAVLARRLGADDTGALAAGALLGASDVITAQLVSGAIAAAAHLPWAIVAADILARAPDRRGRAGGAAALAAAVGAMVLASRWLIAADAVIAALAITAVRAPPGRRLGTLPWVALAVGVAVAVGGVALVPAIAQLSGDVEPSAITRAPWATLELIVPGAQALGATAGAGTYLGGVALLFAVAAIVDGDRVRRGLAGVTAAFAVAAGGVLAPWDAWIGAGGATGQPAEHAIAAAVLLAVLAGLGLSRLVEGSRVDRRLLTALASAAGALVLIVAVLGAARPALAHALDPLVGLDAAVARVDRVIAHAVAACAVALAAIAIVVVGRQRGWVRPGDIAIVVAVTHAAVLARIERPLVERAALAERPSMLVAAERTAEAVVSRDAGLPPRIYRPEHVAAPELRDRVQTFDGATVARAGYAAARWHAPGRQREVDRLWAASAAVGARMFDRFAIELALLPSSVATPAALTVLGERSGVVLVATGSRRPRAFVAPRWRWLPDDDAVRDAMFPPAGVEPLPVGVVARLGDGAPPPDDAGLGLVPCDARAERPERVVVHCDGPAGVAVLADAWAPGWTATVDGTAATVERVDGMLRGVEVGAGAHTIVFAYTPVGGHTGRAVTTIGALALLALLVGSLRSRVAK